MKLNLPLSALVMALMSSSIFASDANTSDKTSNDKKSNRLESFKTTMISTGSILPTVEKKSLVQKTDTNVSISRRADTRSADTRRVDSATNPLKQRLNVNQKRENKVRPDTPLKSSNIHGFSFYSASAYLNYDLDGDGYFSDFTIEFDADYDGGYADVTAVLYYSKNDGPWIEYFETDVFEIHLDDSSDYYQVNTRLLTDFPTSDYDILIDLYENGITGIVATISSDDTQNLLSLPLEDEAHELSSNATQITYVASTISHDADGDQFYTDLTLEYDISSVYSGDLVYAEVILTNSGEGWSQTLTTDNFILGNQTEFVDLVLNTGYTAGWYDVQINIINLYTGEVIANAAQDFSSLASLKLESVNNDSHYDTPSAGGGGVNFGADSSESGGGAISGYFLILFALIGLYIRGIKSQRNSFQKKRSQTSGISN